MAAFCYFWRISPSEYWSLTIGEVSAMVEFADEIAQAKG